MRTLKELRALKKTRAKRIFNGRFHAGNHEEFLAYLEQMISSERPGVSFKLKVIEASDSIQYIENGKPTSYYWRLPKLAREVFGTLEFRSKDYRFLPDGSNEYSYGPRLTKNNITDYGIAVDLGGDMLEYHFED